MTDIVYNKNGVPFDIDTLVTDVNGKADRDLLNVSDTGNIQMANASMPSNTYVNLTLGASGSTQTAPADGYVIWGQSAGSSGKSIGIYLMNSQNQEIFGTKAIAYGNDFLAIYVPVCKGQIFKTSYNASGSVSYFRFIYAVGSESEAS